MDRRSLLKSALVGGAGLLMAQGCTPATTSAALDTGSATAPRQMRLGTAQRGATHYIEFRARSAVSYGHTFAAVGRLNRAGQPITTEIAGLHPATESSVPWMIGHFVPVPSETGASDGDTEDEYIIARYRVNLTTAQHAELMTFVRRLQKDSPTWHAVFYNCNAFVRDIARHMGLEAPSNTLLMPKEFIDEMRRMNRG